MSSAPLRYIGDISREDAQLLARFAARARRILESARARRRRCSRSPRQRIVEA
jgi:hypothetical protein